jgi:hypothetical protein
MQAAKAISGRRLFCIEVVMEFDSRANYLEYNLKRVPGVYPCADKIVTWFGTQFQPLADVS